MLIVLYSKSRTNNPSKEQHTLNSPQQSTVRYSQPSTPYCISMCWWTYTAVQYIYNIYNDISERIARSLYGTDRIPATLHTPLHATEMRGCSLMKQSLKPGKDDETRAMEPETWNQSHGTLKTAQTTIV